MARLPLTLLICALVRLNWGYVLQTSRNLRISNGYDIRIEVAPYMAAVFLGDEHRCGASIIDDYFVLTAAHCVQQANETTNYKVLVGSDQLNTDGIFIDVEQILCHEDFDVSTTENDICLLRLKETVPFGCLWTVGKIALPTERRQVTGGFIAVVAGWGGTETGSTVSNQLRQAIVPVLGIDCCRRIHPDITDNMICAGFKENNFCSGDAGGPLVSNGVIIGVASWDGHGCDSRPGVYTRVDNYLSWIQDTMSGNNQ